MMMMMMIILLLLFYFLFLFYFIYLFLLLLLLLTLIETITGLHLIFFIGMSARFRVMASPYVFSLSHSDTPQSGALLWTSAQPDAETST